MVCLGVSAAERHSKKAHITFFSPDTDVLVLLIANFDRLPKSTSISMVSGVKQIEPIWRSLGPDRSKALLGLHAFSGTDNTGRFAGIGKKTWMKLFIHSNDAIVEALTSLCVEEDISENIVLVLAKFVCEAYQPKGVHIESIPELRWHMFCKHMAESDKLPPTLGALRKHIARAHLQAYVWGHATVHHQKLLDPLENGYHKVNAEGLTPTITDLPPAPDAIIEMVMCKCKGNCSSNRCSCKSKELTCTDLCNCSDMCENDIDTQNSKFDSDDSDG